MLLGGALCESNRLDAIFNTDSGDYFAFQGGQYWKLTDDSVAPGYPKYYYIVSKCIVKKNDHESERESVFIYVF
jgi:hypothetical protein